MQEIILQPEYREFYMVFHGGGWDSGARGYRSAYRGWVNRGIRSRDLGFRLARRNNPHFNSVNNTKVCNMKTITIDGTEYTLVPVKAGPEFVKIPAGTFLIGSPEREAGRYSDEGPQRDVFVEEFEMQKYQTTFDEYDKFCEETGREKPSDSGWGRDGRPVINVSHDDALAYVAWLNENDDEYEYDLPSEEQWEYACRAGSTTAYCFGDNPKQLDDYAVYNSDKTQPVGSKKPNAWGLYDMHGNVWEWTSTEWKDHP